MAGQRMRQPARDRNGSYTALLAAEADGRAKRSAA